VEQNVYALFQGLLLDDDLLEVAFLHVGWLLASPEILNLIDLVALVVVH
jgi:hypothetical protein